MILFPNCKINIGLNITEKRPDGYHNIDTVFYPLPWLDAVELVSCPSTSTSDRSDLPVKISCTGLPVPGNTNDNICLKAYQLLKKDFPHIPSVAIHLHKCIPTGAGLGGGSSNGAFTLQLINTKYRLNLTRQQLAEYALALGSDCPFFIYNIPCYASGRGEQLTPLPINLSDYSFLIVHPGIHIPTAWAFSKITPVRQEKSLMQIVQQPIATWRNELSNAFELPVFREYPTIEEIKNVLYTNGAFYASLSGSGSAVYGIFPKNKIPALNRDKNHIQKIIY